MVADDPDNKIDLKAFNSEINDHAALKKEQENYKDIEVIRKLDNTIETELSANKAGYTRHHTVGNRTDFK